jgi:hypothetical protein
VCVCQGREKRSTCEGQDQLKLRLWEAALFPSTVAIISIKNTEIYLELGGIHIQGCRCSERLKTKSTEGENLTLPLGGSGIF